MSTGTCPRCQKPLEGQVKLCSLCGTTYHADCLRDTRDCLLCATQTSGATQALSKKGKSNIYIFVLLLFIAAALIVLAIIKYTPRKPIAQSSSASDQLEASRTLDTIRQAILRFEDKQGKRFTGTSLKPLTGSFLSSVPTDPWGRSYLLDADVGLLLSYGEDGKPGGQGEARDTVRYFRRPLHPVAAHYGAKKTESDDGVLQIVFNKPFAIIDENAVLSELELVELNSSLDDEGSAVFASFPDHWVIASSSPYHAPEQGLLALKSKANSATARFLAAIKPSSTAINVVLTKANTKGLTERPAHPVDGAPSPCDEGRFGKEAAKLLRPLQPLAPFNGLPGGITIDDEEMIKG